MISTTSIVLYESYRLGFKSIMLSQTPSSRLSCCSAGVFTLRIGNRLLSTIRTMDGIAHWSLLILNVDCEIGRERHYITSCRSQASDYMRRISKGMLSMSWLRSGWVVGY
jgi:hypothetical protein